VKKILLILFAVILSSLVINAQAKKAITKKNIVNNKTSVKKDSTIRIQIITDSGIIIVRLYDSTPNHRDNFVKLVKAGFYDSLLFHRVIPNFMIQGGDPTSKNAPPNMLLGDGGDSMTKIPAEFKPYYFHKRGVLAAARDGDDVNPTRASSACQFYIVTGQKFTDDQLNQIELKTNRKFTPEERMAYETIGGAPWLDQVYTIFGEVESGMEVVDKISLVPRDANDRPLGNIKMQMKIVE